MRKHSSLVAVRFRESATSDMRAAVMREFGRYDHRLELPNESYTVLPLRGKRPDVLRRKRAALASAPGVVRIAPVYRNRQNLVLATDRVLVTPRRSLHDVTLSLHRPGWQVMGRMMDCYVVRVGEHEDPFAASRELLRERTVEHAEPDLVTLFRPFPLHSLHREFTPRPGPEDEYLDEQRALFTTRAIEVHRKPMFGDPAVRIAVLDLGIDTRHDDLKKAVACEFDAVDNNASQEPDGHEYHGTACAGLAAAEPNGIGIRGLGAGCSLMAVKIARADPRSGVWTIRSNDVVRGIQWAWQHGAAVLSISWYDLAASPCVEKEILRAREKGRGGAGCVVVAAAGNRSQPTPSPSVDFPANLEGVLAVAASTPADGPKLYNPMDMWESAAGPEVALAAPGVNNFTTDNVGTDGRNTFPTPYGEYFDFSGTSSATPLVAGAAGLLLSVNTKLTEKQVRAILCATADKVPNPQLYVPNGRNNRMGFGRLNVLDAVLMALAVPGDAEIGWSPPSC